ncbi:glycosyltransferase family 2 protein [Ekhidna sp.]|uniref:glycosyltransferase family 2 protein n=1 Tax=Ekhidna sp. TaxID=2608089 RepID=UPI003B595B0E
MSDVTVIIPTYNASNYIEETLSSVYGQELPPKEIIVVDDGSSDNTANIVRQKHPKVKLLQQENKGAYEALNYGIKSARHDLIALLDHDDIWLSGKLRKQVELMNMHPECQMVFTLLENYMPNHLDGVELKQLNTPLMGIHKSTLMVRKHIFDSVGLFEKSKIELLEWYAKAIDKNIDQKFVNEVLVKRRIHGANQSLTDKSLRQEFPKIIKAILDRRRNEKK